MTTSSKDSTRDLSAKRPAQEPLQDPHSLDSTAPENELAQVLEQVLDSHLDKDSFEQTLTLIGELGSDQTVNPMLPLAEAGIKASHEVSMGLTIPSIETLPALNVAPSEKTMEGFEVTSQIGAGGMGVVEVARQHVLQREVVIKRPHESDPESGQVKALVKEGVLTGLLEHPNIVPVHALGRTKDGRPALVMKRITGVSWRDLIKDPKHPAWSKVQGDRLDWHVQILIQVSNAISFAHSRGVLHRDIKPENVMLGDFGEVYLLDWGIGLKLDDEGKAKAKQFAGTLAFAAPEMLGGTLTASTDIYLLGSTLHEALTGTLRHDGELIFQVLLKVKRSDPYKYGPEIPEKLAEICNKATHRDPSERFPSAEAFREALEEHLRHRNAIDLVDSAQERLQTLQQKVRNGTQHIDTQERLELHGLATECRFALREALRTWPESTQAQQALQECTRLMCKIELDLGNLASAELLIAELDDVPPAFSEALEALREAQKQSTEARKRLKDLEHNLDITVGSQRRTHLMVLFVILLFGTASIATYFTDGLIVTTHKASFLTSFIIIASTVVFAIVGRDTLFHTSISRRMVAFFFTGCAGVLISRSLGFFLPIPVQAVFIFDMIIVGTAFTLAGFAIDTLLFISAAFYYIGIIISIIWPSVSYLMMIFALGFSTAWAGITWQRARKKHIPRH